MRTPAGQSILGKLSKFDTTRCQILRLNAPHSISAGALPQTQLGELTALPRPLAVFKGPTSNGKDGVEEGEWKEKRRGREGKRKGKGTGGKGKGEERGGICRTNAKLLPTRLLSAP